MARTFSVPIIGQSAASGAQVIDGSLKFDEDKNTYLKVTPGSNGNRRTWTWSGWVKRNTFGSSLMSRFFMGGTTSVSSGNAVIAFYQDRLFWQIHSSSERITTNRLFRDTGWYHIVVALDTTLASDYGISERVRIYVNGKREDSFSTSGYPSQNMDSGVNSTQGMLLGAGRDSSGSEPDGPFDGQISNVYLIDGLQLGPGYFGFTDPLTGTWKPKKFRAVGTTVNDGTVWSDSLTGARTDGTNEKDDAFDGSLTTKAGTSATGTGAQLTFTSPKPIHFSSGVRVYVYWGSPNDVTMRLDDGESITVPGNTWTTLVEGTGSFKTLTVNGTSNSAELSAIEVDGVIMQDSTTTNLSFGTNGFYLPLDGNSPIGQDHSGNSNDMTPINFGGSVALDNPIVSGALPILNTTQGGSQAGVGVRTDAHASNLVLALPLLGTTNDVSNQINSGSTTKTVTNNGATASNARSNFYNASFDFDGGDDLEVSSSSDFNYGTGDFTWEAWVYKDTSNNNQYIIDHGSNNGSLLYSSGGQIRYYDGSNNRDFGTLAQNKWHHVAVCRSSSVTNGFLDGKKTELDSSDSKDYPTQAVSIGEYGGGSYNWEGNIQDVRLYKGVAKYTSDFVVPSPSPDILPDTPSGVSGSSKLAKITDGAVAFDGSAGILDAGTSTDFELSDDHTIEAWIYSNDARDVICAYYYYTDGGSEQGWHFGYNSSNLRLNFRNANTNTQIVSETGSIGANQWYHVAVVTSSGSSQIYINGKASGSAADIGTPTTTNVRFCVGGLVYASEASGYGNYFDGYISNLRIIKGTALYSGDFTPPTRTLTEVTNTKVLCCQSNAQPGAAVTAPNMGGVNNGTNWSHFLTTNAGENFDGSGPKYYAFDGNGSNKAYTGNNSDGTTQGTSFLQVNFPSPISGALRVKCDNGNTVRNVTSGDTLLATQSSGSDNQFVDCGDVSNLSKLRVLMSGGSRPAISVVELDGTTLVDPASPIGNASATNFTPFNTDINTVRGQETGYPTFNPLDKVSTNTLSNGNLSSTASATSAVRATNPFPKTGKWYVEYSMDAVTTNGYPVTGISKPTINLGAYSTSGIVAVRPVGSGKNLGWVIDGTDTPSNYMWTGFASSDGDTMQIAYNADEGAFYMGVNNNWWGLSGSNAVRVSTADMISGTNSAKDVSDEEYFAWSMPYTNAEVSINFGQKPFKFPPPDGFQPLNNANVRPETVIARPDHYVGIATYVGNSTGQFITMGMKPDFLWIKSRTNTGSHAIQDSVRGSDKQIQSNTNYAESTNSATAGVLSFDRNGYTLGTESSATGSTNGSQSYVAWAWKAGGNKNTFNVDDVGYATAAAAGITEGTLSLTGASIGTKQGFSICKFNSPAAYDGSTWGHGLTQSPDFVIMKHTGNTGNWQVYHSSIPSKYFFLNSTNAAAGSNNWTITSTTATCGAGLWTHNNVSTVAYHWHNVPGLQKFGTYEGSGVAGNYVHLGFRPALIWIKNVDSTAINNWGIIDSTRSYANVGNHTLATNLNNQESYFGTGASVFGSANKIDLLSDGFRLHETSGFGNTSGITFLYCAWAEAPSIDLYGGGANAR